MYKIGLFAEIWLKFDLAEGKASSSDRTQGYRSAPTPLIQSLLRVCCVIEPNKISKEVLDYYLQVVSLKIHYVSCAALISTAINEHTNQHSLALPCLPVLWSFKRYVECQPAFWSDTPFCPVLFVPLEKHTSFLHSLIKKDWLSIH